MRLKSGWNGYRTNTLTRICIEGQNKEDKNQWSLRLGRRGKKDGRTIVIDFPFFPRLANSPLSVIDNAIAVTIYIYVALLWTPIHLAA